MPEPLHFILNDKEYETTLPGGTLVLDFLRLHARFCGTKEGCKEGDCGACMVLVGELDGDTIHYKPITSCLMPIGEMHGKHLVTIEGLNQQNLTPVQQAIVDAGGSQCGFCTPGIVVSLTGYLLQRGPSFDDVAVKYALGGNLCRCTGYASLKRACTEVAHRFEHNGDDHTTRSGIDHLRKLIEWQMAPPYFESIPSRLQALAAANPTNGQQIDGPLIAGGTDIYVQRGAQLPNTEVRILGRDSGMKTIEVHEGDIHVGALTTFEEFATHPEIQKCIPGIVSYNLYNASWQIRNRATLGGNIVNASPIGDMTALLLALESELLLQRQGQTRTVAMRDFFKGYKKLDLQSGEILTEIRFAKPDRDTLVHFEKVSKRKTLDIASVNSAIRIRCKAGSIVETALTMGGVAPIPLLMKNTNDFLTGKPVCSETVRGAIAVALSEVSPINDIRGSAEYKTLLVRQLLIAHFSTLFPKQITVREFYETH